jgi:transposase
VIGPLPPLGKQTQHAEAGGEEREGVCSSGPGLSADEKLISGRVSVCSKWITLRKLLGGVDPVSSRKTINGDIFLAYVEQCLVPTLQRNDIVVLDNLPAHKVPGVEEAIVAAGATVRYLPQYSPDLNPIEMPFSKFKAYLRKLAERTVPGLHHAIRSFLLALDGQECANYLRHAGYASI